MSYLIILRSYFLRFKELAFSIGVFTIITIVSKIFPFLLLPILTYYLTPGEFGESALFISACSLLIPVIGLRGDAVLISVMGQKSGVLQGDERLGIALYAPLLIAGAMVLLLVGAAIAEFPMNARLGISAQWLFVAILSALLTFYLICASVLWQFNGEMKKYAIMQFAQASVVLVATAALVVGPFPNAAGRNVGYVLPAFLFGIWSLFKLFLLYGGPPRFRITAFKSFCRVVLPLLGATAAHIIASTMDRYAIAWYSGASAVGVYAFGVTMGGVMAVVVEAVDMAWVPYVAKSLRDPNATSNLASAGLFIIGILSILGVVYCFMLPELIDMMARSAAYKEALPIAIATVFAVLCKAGFNLFSAPSLYGGQHRFGLVVNLSLAMLIPISILMAASTMSLTGPQYTIGAAYALAALVYLANLLRKKG